MTAKEGIKSAQVNLEMVQQLILVFQFALPEFIHTL
jgi:hypothetical protein